MERDKWSRLLSRINQGEGQRLLVAQVLPYGDGEGQQREIRSIFLLRSVTQELNTTFEACCKVKNRQQALVQSSLGVASTPLATGPPDPIVPAVLPQSVSLLACSVTTGFSEERGKKTGKATWSA